MKLVFAGTPAFADHALRALIAAGHSIELVLTQPDRPSGRGKRLSSSAVKTTAVAHDLPVIQPARLRDPAGWESVRAAAPDLMVVAAYGLILPAGLLSIPRLGCLNIHASLLPRWRGAAPIQRAIEAGDTRSGISIMQMDAGLDTGPVWTTHQCPIHAEDTGGQLHDRLAALGATAIVAALDGLAAGRLQCRPQPDEGVTYAEKILASDRWLDWRQPAGRLRDRIRAFDPVPGSAGRLASAPDEALKIWRVAVADAPGSSDLSGAPAYRVEGSILIMPEAVLVRCGGDSWLRLEVLQRPGGQRIDCADLQRGAGALKSGDRFLLPDQ